jgi:branched-chain amino acid transport system substrate-binding protein
MYFKEVNAKGGIHGRKIKLLVEDDGCTPIKGVAAVQKLLADKPFMLFGPTCSGSALAALETVTKEGIPWFNAGVSTSKIFMPMRRNVFRMACIPDHLQAKVVVDYDIHNLKARKIAIIHDASEYGKGGKDGIVERMEEYGLKPVAVEALNTGDTDFTTQVLKVKETNPEVVHLYCYAKEAAILARQAKELGLTAQIIGSSTVPTPAFLETAGDAGVGVLCVYSFPYLIDSPTPVVVDFVNKLKANYRIVPGRPSFAAFEGYGSAVVAVEGLRRAGKDLTWEKYIKALETIKDFDPVLLQKVTFSPAQRNGQTSTRFLVILPGKKWQVLGEDVVAREKVEKVE